MENVQQIIHKSRIFTERLQQAIAHQDKLTKDAFDVNNFKYSQSLDVSKKNLADAENKYETILTKIENTNLKVHNIAERCEKISEENIILEKTNNELLGSSKPFDNERCETARKLQ
mgnify:CR=1 FL=1